MTEPLGAPVEEITWRELARLFIALDAFTAIIFILSVVVVGISIVVSPTVFVVSAPVFVSTAAVLILAAIGLVVSVFVFVTDVRVASSNRLFGAGYPGSSLRLVAGTRGAGRCAASTREGGPLPQRNRGEASAAPRNARKTTASRHISDTSSDPRTSPLVQSPQPGQAQSVERHATRIGPSSARWLADATVGVACANCLSRGSELATRRAMPPVRHIAPRAPVDGHAAACPATAAAAARLASPTQRRGAILAGAILGCKDGGLRCEAASRRREPLAIAQAPCAADRPRRR